jgi:hypothetical protein
MSEKISDRLRESMRTNQALRWNAGDAGINFSLLALREKKCRSRARKTKKQGEDKMRKSLLALSAILIASGATEALASRSTILSHRTYVVSNRSEMQNETPAEFCRWHNSDTRYDTYCAPYND